MNVMPRSGWIAAIVLSFFSITAVAQTGARPGFVPDSSEPITEGVAGAEDFADITLLPALGWILTNQSSPVGTTNWFQGNDAVFPAHAGASTAYIAANFNNTGTTGPNQICNYLIMPDHGALDSVTFFTRTVSTDSAFPDRLRVLFSPSGGTTPGDCIAGFGDFTEELLVINEGVVVGGYPAVWTEFTVNPGAEGRVAFVYDVPDAGPAGSNADYIGIDTVSFEVHTPPDQARFLAVKEYDDGNTGEVEVTLSCNTGLPLVQTIGVAPGAPINFVVRDFEQGTLNCTITEVVPVGYTASYDNDTVISEASCAWGDLEGGQYQCTITNSLEEVEIEVTKVWIDENPQFNAQNVAGASWSCNNVAFPCPDGFANGCDNGNLHFSGNPGVDGFSVFPDWEDGTTCSITEVSLLESGIEVDDSECQGLVVFPGAGASCTIFNTRLFEGIPTLSQYGLGLLALLMLGVGFVAFRRVI